MAGMCAVVLGETVLDPAAASVPARERAGTLTKRQREVLTLAGRGLSNGQIAAQLVVTRRTVEKHLTSIYATLGVSGRIPALNAVGLHHRYVID